MVNECMRALASIPTPVSYLAGNGDRTTLAYRSGQTLEEVPEKYRDGMQWVSHHLEESYAREIDDWPQTIELGIDGLGSVLFCHATPYSDTDIFTVNTSERVLRQLLATIEADLIVCGHTHMQFERIVGTKRVLNSGSIGMPFGEPEACWLALGPDVQFRQTTYDLESAANRILATDFPRAKAFCEESLLKRPSKEDMLRVFDARSIEARVE